MRRRDFVRTGIAASAGLFLPRRSWILGSATRATSHVIPMDDAQDEHLKAYGLAFRALERGERGEWLLNYRNGAFLLPASDALQRDAALAGVTMEPVDDATVVAIKGEIQASNMDAIPLEKVPKIAVYAPPDAAPWDDAVTMVLNYAGIQFQRVWDPEVIANGLDKFDWLHLHHEDFTGQYSKFAITSAGAPWLQAMMQLHQSTAARLGFANVPDLKRAVAQRIAAFVERGGFLFAMCTATETLDLALASEGLDIAAAYADGTPMDPLASSKMHWDKALAFRDAQLELSPSLAAFSDIDGHQVNTSERQPLGAFDLFNFSAKIDPVATMLVQNQRQVIPDFYGLTTSWCWRTSPVRRGSSTSTASAARGRGPSSGDTTPKTRSMRLATPRPTCRCIRIHPATGCSSTTSCSRRRRSGNSRRDGSPLSRRAGRAPA
jgi:hypothetical protein